MFNKTPSPLYDFWLSTTGTHADGKRYPTFRTTRYEIMYNSATAIPNDKTSFLRKCFKMTLLFGAFLSFLSPSIFGLHFQYGICTTNHIFWDLLSGLLKIDRRIIFFFFSFTLFTGRPFFFFVLFMLGRICFLSAYLDLTCVWFLRFCHVFRSQMSSCLPRDWGVGY